MNRTDTATLDRLYAACSIAIHDDARVRCTTCHTDLGPTTSPGLTITRTLQHLDDVDEVLADPPFPRDSNL